jgi:DNA-binding beta-propeller fold protein YncE
MYSLPIPPTRLLHAALLAGALWVPAAAQAQACRAGTVAALPTPAVSWQRSWVAELGSPARLATDPAGRVVIADPARRRLILRAADGALAGEIAVPGLPVAVAVDAFGSYWVGDADGGRVLRLEADGRVTTMLGIGDGEFGRPGDIAIDPAVGEIYVTDTARHLVRVYSPGGVWLRTIGEPSPTDDSPPQPGQFRTPTGIAIAGDELLVGDQLNFRIQAFDKQSGAYRYCLGTFRASSFFSPNSGPSRTFGMVQGLAVDAVGRLYVADAYQGQVVVVDRGSGAIVSRIGAFGDQPGELRVPSDLLIDGAGRLVVANTDGARLDLFSLDGAPDVDTVIPARARLSVAQLDRASPPGLVDVVLSVPGYRAADAAPDSLRVGGQPAALLEVGEFDGDSVGDLRAVFDAQALLAGALLGEQQVAVTAAFGALEARAEVALTITDSSLGRDTDGDGVADPADACPATAAGSVVDAAGCAIAQRCPCEVDDDRRDHRRALHDKDDRDRRGAKDRHRDDDERSDRHPHGQHLRCVTQAARDLLRAGRIGRTDYATLVRDAARSTCGRKP